MSAIQQDLSMEQGTTFEWLVLINDVNGVPLNMSGYVGGTAGARGMIRKRYSDTTILKSFTISILNSTGVNTAITAGQVHLATADVAALQPLASGSCYLLIRLVAADTAALPTTCVYDIEIEDTTGYVFKPYRGNISVLPESTR